MSILADITFREICLTLVTLAVLERAVIRYLPEYLVGPEGLLLRTRSA